MQTKFAQNIKKKLAFTLVELVIVIAIISLLAAVIVVAINPNSIFINGRNSTRASDLTTLNKSIGRYLADSPLTASRTINDLSGYANLYSNAINNAGGRCSNGTNGVQNTIQGAYTLDTTSSPTGSTIDLTPLISNRYLPKLPKEPDGSNYKACIDTMNGNQLVIYSEKTENKSTLISSPVGQLPGNIDLSSGLVGYWKMDETSWNGTAGEVKDSSGNNNNGVSNCFTTCTRPTTTAGLYANSGNFDGTTQNITLPAVNVGNSALSYSIWFKTNGAASSQQTLISEMGTLLTISNNNQIMWWSDVNMPNIAYNYSFTLGTWYNIIVTQSGNTYTLYLNGTQVATGSTTNIINNVSSQPSIGSWGNSRFLNGSIDEARYYNRALSDTEVSALYNYAPQPVLMYKLDEGTGTVANDATGNNHIGSINNANGWTQGKYGKGLVNSIASGTARIFTPSSTDLSSGSITLNFWLNLTSESNGGWAYIGKHLNSNPDASEEYTFEFNTDGRWYSRFNNSTSMYLFATQGATNLDNSQNKWHFFSMIYDKSLQTIKIIEDGTNILYSGTSVNITINPTTFNFEVNLALGNTVDNIQFYNYARTPSQILSDMN